MCQLCAKTPHCYLKMRLGFPFCVMQGDFYTTYYILCIYLRGRFSHKKKKPDSHNINIITDRAYFTSEVPDSGCRSIIKAGKL